MPQDVTIPKPLTSGATDVPNAPQGGTADDLPPGFSRPTVSDDLPPGFSRPASGAPPAPVKVPTTPAPSQPSLGQVLTQPTDKTDKEYLGYTGPAGVAGATIHGLNEVGKSTLGAIKGAAAMFDPRTQPGENVLTKTPVVRALQPIISAARQVPQIPGALRDIMSSPAPGMYLGRAAEDTASQGAGQALTGIASEGLPKAIDLARTAVPKIGEVATGAAKASGIGLSPIEKLVKAAGPSVRDANFPQALQTAAPELARQNAVTPVKSVQDMADTAHTAADNLWKQRIEPQITRNAAAPIDGSRVAQGIRSGIDEGMRDLFPEQAAKAEQLASKFDGPIPLSKANAYLKTLNAQLKGFYKMSPEARAAAGVTDGRISSMEDAANGLRQEMYSKLDSLGETDPAGLRQQYGALKQVQSVFGKRAIVSGRQAPLNLAQIMAIAGGAGESAGALFSGHPGAAVAGAAPIAATTLLKYFNSPDVLTRRGISGLEVPPAEPPTPPPNVPRSVGAAAASPATEVPEPLRPAAGLSERRSIPRSMTMSQSDLEAAIKNRKPVTTPFDDTIGARETMNRDINMPKPPGGGGRTGNSPGSISAEEANRPGTNYLVKRDGSLTAQSKSYTPEETKPGQAHVTLMSNGDYRVNAGDLTPQMEKGLRSGTKAKNRIY